MQMMEGLAQAIQTNEENQSEYEFFTINSFTIQDIIDGNAKNYNRGLLRILDKLKKNARLYSFQFNNSETDMFGGGFSYIYWIKVKDKWYYVSNPYDAFKNK